MARVLVDTYMVRYPLGGMLSWGLQYLVGLHRLGHEVFLVERASTIEECFAPAEARGDPVAFGVETVAGLLGRVGLGDRWYFRGPDGHTYGRSQSAFAELVRTADLYVDMGTRSLLSEMTGGCPRVLIDGEPGYAQMRWASCPSRAAALADYDHLFTNGLRIGASGCEVPTLGRTWHPIPNPVDPDLFRMKPPGRDAPWTTVMNWRSHGRIEYEGRSYGQKDVEFERIMDLPLRATARLEVAVAGEAPEGRLRRNGWSVRDGHQVTRSFEAYRDYIADSRGELSVCKNVFVATGAGWFSDRSAAYMAAGRPVILQDTGFSAVLPTGTGLLGFEGPDEALSALHEVESDYRRHQAAAREIAREHLAADVVMAKVVAVALG